MTNILRDELNAARMGHDKPRMLELMDRLFSIVFAGRDRDSLEAIRLIFGYVDGLPIQTVELDAVDVARKLAEEKGLDPDQVVFLFENIRKMRSA